MTDRIKEILGMTPEGALDHDVMEAVEDALYDMGDPKAAGAYAFAEGLPELINPYPKYSDKWSDFKAGYEGASNEVSPIKAQGNAF